MLKKYDKPNMLTDVLVQYTGTWQTVARMHRRQIDVQNNDVSVSCVSVALNH